MYVYRKIISGQCAPYLCPRLLLDTRILYTPPQKNKKREAHEHHDPPYCPSWLNSSIWAAWNGYTDTSKFERKSSRGKKNRRRGDPSAEPLGIYHCGSFSAAKIMEEMVIYYILCFIVII